MGVEGLTHEQIDVKDVEIIMIDPPEGHDGLRAGLLDTQRDVGQIALAFEPQLGDNKPRLVPEKQPGKTAKPSEGLPGPRTPGPLKPVPNKPGKKGPGNS